MDHLKIATLDDKKAIIEMGKHFHRDLPVSDIMPLSYNKIDKIVTQTITSPDEEGIILLSMEKKKPVGMLLATVQENPFHEGKVAVELAWWVEKKYRKSNRGVDLIKAYIFWANKIGCKAVHMSCLHGMNEKELGALFEKMGFNPIEHSYSLFL